MNFFLTKTNPVNGEKTEELILLEELWQFADKPSDIDSLIKADNKEALLELALKRDKTAEMKLLWYKEVVAEEEGGKILKISH